MAEGHINDEMKCDVESHSKAVYFMPPALLAFLLVLAALWNVQARAQNTSGSTMHRADIDEVDTIEHILNSAYKAVSGPSGPRDWDHFRSLLLPDARFIASHRDPSGKIVSNSLTADQFIQRAEAIFNGQGFYESPVANRIEMWDHIAHVWSTYESRHSPGEKPYTRGINSFQLLNDGTRWWIVTIYWQNEDTSHQIPKKYLK